ncbi:MAG: acyl carrier protein [Paludibacter sp.]|nr:acyl carrier protein [Paludibacter sp.]
MDTLSQLTTLFREVFLDESIILTTSTTSSDVDGWDSFAYLNILMAVENHFGISISDTEAPHLRNIGDMIALIENKISVEN